MKIYDGLTNEKVFVFHTSITEPVEEQFISPMFQKS